MQMCHFALYDISLYPYQCIQSRVPQYQPPALGPYVVCGAAPSGTVLCCAVKDGTMCHCKAVLQRTPYSVFVFNYLGWIGMLYWEKSLPLPCFLVTLGMPYLPEAGPLG